MVAQLQLHREVLIVPRNAAQLQCSHAVRVGGEQRAAGVERDPEPGPAARAWPANVSSAPRITGRFSSRQQGRAPGSAEGVGSAGRGQEPAGAIFSDSSSSRTDDLGISRSWPGAALDVCPGPGSQAVVVQLAEESAMADVSVRVVETRNADLHATFPQVGAVRVCRVPLRGHLV